MSFNKWYPNRLESAPRRTQAETRAWALRVAWYASTMMLIAGYVLLFLQWA